MNVDQSDAAGFTAVTWEKFELGIKRCWCCMKRETSSEWNERPVTICRREWWFLISAGLHHVIPQNLKEPPPLLPSSTLPFPPPSSPKNLCTLLRISKSSASKTDTFNGTRNWHLIYWSVCLNRFTMSSWRCDETLNNTSINSTKSFEIWIGGY